MNVRTEFEKVKAEMFENHPKCDECSSDIHSAECNICSEYNLILTELIEIWRVTAGNIYLDGEMKDSDKVTDDKREMNLFGGKIQYSSTRKFSIAEKMDTWQKVIALAILLVFGTISSANMMGNITKMVLGG